MGVDYSLPDSEAMVFRQDKQWAPPKIVATLVDHSAAEELSDDMKGCAVDDTVSIYIPFTRQLPFPSTSAQSVTARSGVHLALCRHPEGLGSAEARTASRAYADQEILRI